jgi:transposase
MQVTTIGLDIAKSLFQVHGIDRRGKVVLRKRLARAKVLEFFANLPRCLVGLEAGGGAHYWARELRALGHDARLMPPQYVRAYVKTNKHGAADAEACCEAVQRPGMRFVPIKSEEQQALLMLRAAPRRPPRSALGARRGVRDQLIGQRTATINALRGHLTEFGIVAAQRQAGMRQLLAVLGEVEDDRIPPLARKVLQTLATHLRELESRLAGLDRRLVALTRTDPVCRVLSARLAPSADVVSARSAAPGVGPVIATAFAATVPDATAFRSGRHLAARGWLPGATSGGRPGAPRGLVPRQHSSGGKVRQLGLSKRGDGYLRRQLIHGARALVWRTPGRESRLDWWINGLRQRRPFNVVVAAVGQQAGPHSLGDASARRGLSRRGIAPAAGQTFHELRGRTSR